MNELETYVENSVMSSEEPFTYDDVHDHCPELIGNRTPRQISALLARVNGRGCVYQHAHRTRDCIKSLVSCN